MKADAKKCRHYDVEILNVTPAAGRWGLAILTDPDGPLRELFVETVATWATVRCNCCGATITAPMTASGGRLEVELNAEDRSIQTRLIEPGLRPIVVGGFISVVPGEWTSGQQDIGSDPLPSCGERST